MYRIANTLSYGMRKLISTGKVSNQTQKGINSYQLLRKEDELFSERVFYWKGPTMLTGPSRCGKTMLINQYIQKSPSWYIIKHDRQLVESCGMDIVKSFAVAFNNHLENLERIYENQEIPKSITDKWNINKYLLRTPKIKMSSANSRYVSWSMLNAVTNQIDIYNGEKPFIMILDDFDSIHLINEFEWTRQLLFNLRRLIIGDMVKAILIGKNPFKIFYYLQEKTCHTIPISISMGFVSRSDMMKYLQEKELSLSICNKIIDCFGGDINIVSNLLANKEKQVTETYIELYYQSMIFSRLLSLIDIELSLSSEERDTLREIYKRLQTAEYISRIDYIKEFSDSILDKFIETNLLSSEFAMHISEGIDRPEFPGVITYPYPWCKDVVKEFLKW